MNTSALASAVARTWDTSIVPQLVEYIRIPAKSPHFDPRWEANGHIERVIRLAEAWVRQQPVRGLALEIVRLPGRTPVLYFDVPGTGSHTVLLYGHLDKQPEMTGWREGLGPLAAGAGGGQALRSRRRGRRLRGLRLARRHRRAAGAGRGPRALCRPDRNLRGERQLRPARVPRAARAAHGRRGLRGGPRFRLRRLRASVGDDVVARPRGRDVVRRRADRGRAFGRRERRRAVLVSHCSGSARPPRGQLDRPRAARGLSHADPRGTRATGEGRGGDHGRNDGAQVSLHRPHPSRCRPITPRRCSIGHGARHCP